MELRLIHFYPDLMSLYGSYANLLVLKRYLEGLGNSVRVEAAAPGAEIDLSGADFLFMGAGTERAQKAALADFLRFGPAVKALAEAGMPMLFAGNAMELLGASVTDAGGKVWPALGFAEFSTVETGKRAPEDVIAHTALWDSPVVGFMNKCSLTQDAAPLFDRLSLGFGNEEDRGAEGYLSGNVLATHITGPVLVKNPDFTDFLIKRLFAAKGWELPEKLPVLPYEREAYEVTRKELEARIGG